MDMAKAAPAVNINLITAAHCSAGIMTLQQCSMVTPKFWAQSETRRAIAEPASEYGMQLDTSHGVVLIGFLVDIAQARWFGRTAEAWIKNFRDGDQFDTGSLGAMADIDPEIRTAIISQGVDMLTGEQCTTTAAFDLDDVGSPVWHRYSHADLGGGFEIVAEAVIGFVRASRPKRSVADMEQFIEACGWRVQIITD